MRKITRIGLFGFGCVGRGLYDVLNQSQGMEADIVSICVKDKNKTRSLPADYFTYDKSDVLNNPNINLVVELIDNADEAFEIVTEALQKGKSVVSANKKMIAEHFEELYNLQRVFGSSLLYEGSSCGSIPIIRTLEEYYDNELLNSVQGIFNGTTNYILTKVAQEGIDYDTALHQAQELGFAESDPTLDVQGYDALYKACIVAAHAFGVFVKPADVFCYGIPAVGTEDVRIARERGMKIKLLATIRKTENQLAVFVMPAFVDSANHLYKVDNEYNGVFVEGVYSDGQFFQGKGAGSYPTGSAVLSDVSAQSYNYRYEYKKHRLEQQLSYGTDLNLRVYLRYADESLLQHFPFRHVYERHYEPDRNFNYLIGDINLQDLLNINNLRELPVFIALMPDVLSKI